MDSVCRIYLRMGHLEHQRKIKNTFLQMRFMKLNFCEFLKNLLSILQVDNSQLTFTCSKSTIETLEKGLLVTLNKSAYSRPILHLTVDQFPLLRKLYKALF